MQSFIKKYLVPVSLLALLLAIPAYTYAQPINIVPNIAPQPSIANVIRAVINILFVVAAVIAIIFLIWGGIKWILSGGDKAGVESARNTIIAAIVGLVIVFLTFFVLTLVFTFLGFGNLFQFNLPNVNSPEL